jgi:hypothetical protein
VGVAVLGAFFPFAVNRKWSSETPISSDIKPPVGSSKSADKMPFSDEEQQRHDSRAEEWASCVAWLPDQVRDRLTSSRTVSRPNCHISASSPIRY